MKLLKNILYKVNINAVIGTTHVKISSVYFNSQQVTKESVFVAIKGKLVNGHDFIGNAIANGARSVICETLPQDLNTDITYIQVDNSNKALATIASNFYENPSRNLKLIGVTGTNGKTTVATLLYQLFKKAGYKVGLISTVNIYVNNTKYETNLTTPDSFTINKYIYDMNMEGVEYCFMEVSSHGIDQYRTQDLHFAAGIFTNLSHDHLDYHNTFSAYRDTKKAFFDQLPSTAFSLINIDDKNGSIMMQNTVSKTYTYALKQYANYKTQILENQFDGLLLKINDNEVWTKLIGNFNAYNLTAIFGTADQLGLEAVEILKYISELENVDGRFQYFEFNNIIVIIDYAHTPDALTNVLQNINEIRTKNEMLITVVGCGGDRDKKKRPKMGHIASALSTKTIFTSDNPRTEDPEQIIKEIEAGVEPQHFKKIISITDRKQAIKTACQLAKPKDIILIAGKGHETYQEVNGKRTDFNDYMIAKQFLKQLQE